MKPRHVGGNFKIYILERKIIIRLITFNLILASLIILDLCIPGRESQVKELDSIYSHLTHTGGSNKPTYEMRHIIDLSNGESYRIGKLPDKDYAKGTKLKIVKSRILNNVNEISLLDKTWKKIYVGFFYNIITFCLFALAISVSIVNFIINNKGLNIALVASSMFIAIVTFLYLFYY